MKLHFSFLYIIFISGCAGTINSLNVFSIQTAAPLISNSDTKAETRRGIDDEKTPRPIVDIIHNLEGK